MQEPEALQIVGYIDAVIKNHDKQTTLDFVHDEVQMLCKNFSIYV